MIDVRDSSVVDALMEKATSVAGPQFTGSFRKLVLITGQSGLATDGFGSKHEVVDISKGEHHLVERFERLLVGMVTGEFTGWTAIDNRFMWIRGCDFMVDCDPNLYNQPSDFKVFRYYLSDKDRQRLAKSIESADHDIENVTLIEGEEPGFLIRWKTTIPVKLMNPPRKKSSPISVSVHNGNPVSTIKIEKGTRVELLGIQMILSDNLEVKAVIEMNTFHAATAMTTKALRMNKENP